MSQPPPPQYSPDGLFWWDGTRWVPLARPPQAPPPPPAYPVQPPSYAPPGVAAEYLSAWDRPPALPWTVPGVSQHWYGKPSPGLRIVLIVCLALEVLTGGVLALAFAAATIGGGQDLLSYGLGAFVVITFIVSLIALVGVIVRASWSRWLAIAAGILACWWLVGVLLGIPILVTAARAPDLARLPRA